MELIWARAAGMVRRGWRATLALAILAGIAAGVAMGILGAGRRTATAYDRFAAFADVPELLINFCPPDVDMSAPGAIEECYVYDAAEERRVVAALPEVDQAVRGTFRGLTVAPASDPDDTTIASGLALLDPGLPPSNTGRYLLVDGRDASEDDEIVVNEVLAERAGVGVGDDVVVRFWAPDEIGTFGADGLTFHGPSVEAEVVGISRALTDLAAAQVGFGSDEAAIASVPLEMTLATRDAGGFTGVLVEATDDDAEAAQAAIEAALPDHVFNVAPALGPDEIEPTRDAIRYEAQATTILGLVLAVLAATFVGQAVARQSRREWDDGPILRAVGVTTREATASALLRGVAVGLPAAVVSVAIAVALSPQGPVGVGRRAEVDPGVAIDWPVLVVGAAATLLVCGGAAAIPLLRGRALRTGLAAPPRERPGRSLGLPPVATAGLHLARSRQRGGGIELATALASAGAAVVVVVAAISLTASFDDLAATPARFGATWDVSVGADLQEGTAAAEAAFADPSLRGSIDEAAVITGTDMRIAGEVAWVHAFVPLDSVTEKVVEVPIDEGRPPSTAREIALGALTMRSAGLEIGDEVEVASTASGERFEMTIVGTAMINDNFEASPGRGAVVTPEFIEDAAAEIVGEGDPIVIGLVPSADVDAFTDELRSRVDTAVELPLQQAAVRNVGRIRDLPYVMAAVVALLAIASMVHALVLAVGRHRRVLGVLKGIGFTRGQVGGAVAWQASAYAVAALVVALPLGVVVGRWGWRVVAEALGVPAVPVVPVLSPVIVVIGLLVLANLAAAYPAWRAARQSTAAALRTE